MHRAPLLLLCWKLACHRRLGQIAPDLLPKASSDSSSFASHLGKPRAEACARGATRSVATDLMETATHIFGAKTPSFPSRCGTG